MKNLILIFILVTTFYAEEDSSTSLIKEESLLSKEVSNRILQEEQVSLAYEKYLLKEFRRPTVSDLEEYVNIEGIVFQPEYNGVIDMNTDYLTKFTGKYLDVYTSNIYRNHTVIGPKSLKIGSVGTYFYGDIYINMKNEMARNIDYLLGKGFTFSVCNPGSQSQRYCFDEKKEKMSIYSNFDGTGKYLLLMQYEIKNYKTGPYVIRDTSVIVDNADFKILKDGVRFYTVAGASYIKKGDGLIPIQ